VVAYCRNLNLHELLVHFKAFAHITFPKYLFPDLNPLGEFDNLAAVTKESKDPNIDPFILGSRSN
jgi:hypothetical protein